MSQSEARKPHAGRYVAYYRVSTTKQGEKGLGIKAQKAAVAQFLNGGDWELIAELTEVESGRMKKRPKLEEALALCRKEKATLVIARLDRLYRNVAAVATLMESKVKFVCCDMPEADEFMMHILAAVAQREAKMIRERTTAALNGIKREIKREGTYTAKSGRRIKKLGNPDPLPASRKGRAVLIKQADEYAERVMPHVRELYAHGYQTLRDIAQGLMRKGIETRRGGSTWGPSQVANLLKRRA